MQAEVAIRSTCICQAATSMSRAGSLMYVCSPKPKPNDHDKAGFAQYVSVACIEPSLGDQNQENLH